MPVALVLGCAENVWEDAAAAHALFTPDAVFAVKNMIYLWPFRVDYGVNLHPERTDGYLRERRQRGLSDNFPVWAHRNFGGGYKHRVSSDWQGSTGLLAVKIALEEKFDAVVLAGCPMDPKLGHVVRHKKWDSAQLFMKGWKVAFPKIEGKVRSMSGWTQELLGAPSAEWLREKGATPADPEWVRITKEKADGQLESCA